MIGRCLEHDESFGIALILDGDEVGGHAIPRRIGTEAAIIACQRNAHGEYDIVVEGQRRFAIRSLDQSREDMRSWMTLGGRWIRGPFHSGSRRPCRVPSMFDRNFSRRRTPHPGCAGKPNCSWPSTGSERRPEPLEPRGLKYPSDDGSGPASADRWTSHTSFVPCLACPDGPSSRLRSLACSSKPSDCIGTSGVMWS